MVHDFWAYHMTFGEFQAVTAVSKVLATANKNGVTSHVIYAANGDWLFITCYVLKSIDHAISIQNMVLQELWKPQYNNELTLDG